MKKNRRFLSSFVDFPNDFQEKFLTKAVDVLKKEGAIQLVSAPGAGSSLMLRSIIQIDNIRAKYFEGEGQYRFCYLDGSKLLERSSLALTRLFLSEICQSSSVPMDDLQAARELEKELGLICKEQTLIVIIDHLSELDYEEFKKFFNTLANFHRNYESKMKFIFSVHKPVVQQADLVNFERLARIIASNVFYVPTLCKKDAFWFAEERAKYLDIKLSKTQLEEIFQSTGGFPRTIRRIVEVIAKGLKLSEILTDPWIDNALSLHLDELSTYPFCVDNIPILATYVQFKKGGLVVGESIGGIGMGEKLTKNEVKVLEVFLKKNGEIVSRDEGIRQVWGENALDISDHAYDQIIHRLRRKLTNAKPRVILETVRGRGHILNFT